MPKSNKHRPAQNVKPAVASSTSYKRVYGMAGCGLGSLVADSPDRYDDKVFQLISSLLNNLFGAQTFALTTGTSNCGNTPAAIAQMEREVFVENNLVSLQKEAAKGEGEHLNALSDVMGCLDYSKDFSALSKAKFDVIFSDDEPHSILSRYVNEIRKSDVLSKTCHRI